MGKETKIPALTGAELKKIEEIETSVVAAIKDLRAAVINLDGLLHKNTTSKDLKEFYKWARFCDLEMEGLIAEEGHSLIDDVEYAFEGIFADMKEREKFQKVYREGFVDLGYDYVDKEDLEADGFFKCPGCGTWLFGEDEFCPTCGREGNVIPFPNSPFAPFKSESGLTIDPMLLSFEEIADIFERKKNQVPVEEDDEDDGWDDLSDGVWNETDSDDWCDCAGCPCCECMGFGEDTLDEDGFPAGIEEQVSRAYDEATEALDYLYAAIAQMEIGPHINCLKSDPIQDFRKSVYLGWVYDTFFADKHSPYNLRGLWEKMQIALEELKPHLNNTEDMVMAKVYVQDDDGEVIEEFSRTKYIPLEEAQETARICPNCGLWVDNEIDVCDCGEWLAPMADIAEEFEYESDIQMDRDDFNDYVEWLIEKKGKQAAFEYCARVYQKDMSIVGDWVQKLGEELVSEQENKD